MFFETNLTRERIDRMNASGAWANRLLNDWLDDDAARVPRKTAIVDGRHRLTYAELRALAHQAARAFVALGVRPGDVVTVQLPNGHEFVVVTLALEAIGAVINPVAPIFRERELTTILRLARSVAVVTTASFRGWDYPAMYAGFLGKIPSVRATIVCGEDGAAAGLSWERFLAMGERVDAAALALLRPDADQVIEVIFTSGTTGEPKGAMHTANTISSAVRHVAPALRLGADDVFHMSSTLGHQTGFLYGLNLPIHLGATVVYQDVWEVGRFVDLVEQERVTFTMGATPFLADTVRAVKEDPKRDVSSLAVFICGGAPIPQPLAEETRRRLPCHLAPGWGMTELGLVTTVYRDDAPEKVVTSDGRPFPGSEVAVRGEDGRRAANGEEGELVARGPGAFVGYVQGRRFTDKELDAEGWFATGDRARIDADGFIRISGRTKDLIIRGGENVPVKEVEDVLIRHPKVRNVAVVAAPHPRLGEVGCACVIVEGADPPTLAELTELLAAERVTRQFWPERVLVVAEFPMTPSGKVQKFRLRELAIESSAS